MKGSKIHMCVTLGHHILPEGVKHVIRQPRAATLTLSAPMLMRKYANCLANPDVRPQKAAFPKVLLLLSSPSVSTSLSAIIL